MEAETLLAPASRTHTLPPGLPERTIGFQVLAWIQRNLKQPNGPHAGKPFMPTPGQARFILWFYAVDEDGRWLFNRAARRLAKGSGKSPFAAVLALAELLGPVRFAGFEPKMPGGCIGVPVSMPLVQIAAVAERQTANTMRMIRRMSSRRTALAKKYDLDPGKTFIETPDGGKLEQITSEAGTAEGAESTFVVGDETEHWTPTKGGQDLMNTLMQNSDKTGSRVLSTENAWVPGAQSVAEDTFDEWVIQQEGRTRGSQGILYDAVIAPPNTALTDDPEPGEISLTEGLRIVYADCPWVDIEPLKSRIWSPRYPVTRSRRFFLNQPNADSNAWLTLQEWTVLANPGRIVEKDEEVVLFFDGSKSGDHTALIGCCMSDGHVFTLGVWEPEPGEVIDVAAVDSAVRKAFESLTVVAFWADVREWEAHVKRAWPDEYGDDLLVWSDPKAKVPQPIAWDMRSSAHTYQFGQATEQCIADIKESGFTHDGDWRLTRHVANARTKESRGLEMIKKESPKSPNKIDAAICMIGARMLRSIVLASSEWEEHSDSGEWVVW